MTDHIVVLGGTGKTGRRVAEQLAALGAEVRVGSRSGTPAFDWEDRSTWTPVLEGARAAYLSYYPDLAVPGAAEAIRDISALALSLGVRRLVLLSGRGEVEAQRAEAMLQASGADWTIVRCSWFAQNFSEGAFAELIRSGEVALPAGDARDPFVDADDIADVAVAALTQDGHAGRLYEVTGPRALTFAEAVAEIGAAAGRELRYVEVPLDDWVDGAAQLGEPPEVLELLRYLFGEVLGGNEAVADGVPQALGRPARDFGDFARRTASTGVWSVAA